MFSRRFGLAIVAATLCLGAQAAHAQASPVNYWIPGWPMGFSGDAGESPDAYGSFPSFDFRDLGNGSSYARYNFSNGFFVGSQRSSMGFSSLGQSAFGGFGSIYSEGTQFGYSLKNGGGPPVTFFAGFDTLKYNTGIGSPLRAVQLQIRHTARFQRVCRCRIPADVQSQPVARGRLCPAVGPNRQRDQFAARRLAVRHRRPSLARGPAMGLLRGMCRRSRNPARQSWPLDCIRTG